MNAKNEIASLSSQHSKGFLLGQKKSGYPALSDQHKLFAYYYIQEYNHGDAAERAGFARSTGISLTRQPLLGSFIADLKEEMFSRLSIDADMVRIWWLDTIPKLAGKESITKMDRDGNEIEGKNFDGPSLVSALKELNRVSGLSEGGDEDNGRINVSINLGELGVSQQDAKSITIEGRASSGAGFDEDGAPK